MAVAKQAVYTIILIYLVIALCQGTLDFTRWRFYQPYYSQTSLDAHGQTGIRTWSGGGGGGSGGTPSSNVEMLKLYDSANSIAEIDRVDWGTCYVGESKTKTVYMKNVDNTNITMTFETSDWNPTEASNYLKLDWDYRNETIMPTETLPVKFVLWIAGNITGITNFSFYITIWTTEL